ncbi:unannotated protein [freshwater metagenome]|uniref:Unannotated protein n=1 Tax=freshwater metagenome TaxID=449393 RepID=A0A6J7CKH4_9ZZZZ|nr:hypothetical protein [Actinomycetota bacterium]MSW25705.1 hypothetical protein [Actinomycetota bacterium]MSW33437.1 hypothetical protein [Actinomycetota bacterium]MSX30461.1 hypothetical protein [Actinomycetota bacterium]MSX52158.1 hypothetical protein [Actinomycetota bacterium]
MNKRFFAALGTVILGAAVIAGIGTYVAAAKNDSRVLAATAAGTMDTPQGNLPHYTLDLSVYPDAMFGGHGNGGGHPDWVSYGPVTNFEVPAHSAITITVTNYDGGETLNNDFFGKIRGTIDGSATLNGTRITSVAPDHVGHTFTVHGVASKQTELFFSVPMKAVPEEAMPEEGYTKTPNVTVFTVITGDAGEYIWNCEYPCGDGTIAKFGNAMSAMGYMSGHFNVVKG